VQEGGETSSFIHRGVLSRRARFLGKNRVGGKRGETINVVG